MDSTQQPSATPSTAPPGVVTSEDRSTARPAHTPRGARNGDHPGRPGAIPPAPGRLSHVRVPLILLALLAVISWQVAAHGPLLGLDTRVQHGVHELRGRLHSQWVDYFARGLADLGGSFPAIPVLLGAAGLAAWRGWRAGGRRWWIPLPTAALAALLIPLLVVPAKAWFARPGPLGEPMLPGEWGWYPSGHTATSAIAYGAAALLAGRAPATAAARRRLYGAAGLACLAVGAGLIWSDYHWLLDVTASWCLAGVVLWSLARWAPAR